MGTHINEIIARLEKATGADRALDEEIAVAVTPTVSTPDDLMYATLRDRKGGDATHPGNYFIKSRSGASARTAAHYTSSIDAALSLVPEGFPPNTEISIHLEADRSFADVKIQTRGEYEGEEQVLAEGEGNTIAIALCIAALRSRSNKGEG